VRSGGTMASLRMCLVCKTNERYQAEWGIKSEH